MTTSAASPPGWEEPACTFAGSPRQVVAAFSGFTRFLSCTSPVDWTTDALPNSVEAAPTAVFAETLTWTSPLDVAGRLLGRGATRAGVAGTGAKDWLAGSTQPGLHDVRVTASSTGTL